MKMKTIHVTIKGISPMLNNRFTDANALSVESGTSSAIRSGGRGTPREQADPKRYLDSKGRSVFPGPNVFSCIVEAGKFHKSGKKQITTGRSSLIPAGLTVNEIEIPIYLPQTKSEAPWEVDSRPVVNPSTKGRMMCHRPRFDEWELTFSVDVDVSFFDPKLIRQIIDDAGSRLGLGDYRPDRKGPFGRFKVTNWKEEVVV